MACEPAHTIVQRLGGIKTVSEACGVERIAVWKWAQPKGRGGTGGTIPQRHHLRLLEFAQEQGAPLSAEDFLPRAQEAA